MGLRRGAGFEGIARLAALAVEMPQNAIHDPEIRNDRDHSHLGAARAQQRIDLNGLMKMPQQQAAEHFQYGGSV
jgi:hypothetical protein